MAVQRSRADLVYSALEGAERTWRLGDVEVQVTGLAWDEAKNRVTVDARVIYQGDLIADDRWHFANPPLLTHDGTFVTQFRYESNFGDPRWLTVDERDAMPASERRQLRATGIARQHPRLGYNPLKAFQNSFIETARIVTKGWTRRRLERIGLSDEFRGDTLSVRSGTADGNVSDADNTWASTQNGPGETTTTTGNILLVATQISGTSWLIRQGFLGWDTSSLGASATVSDFDITLYADAAGLVDTDTCTMEWYIYDWGGTIGTDDYRDCSPSTNITNLTKMASMALSSWNDTSNAANALTSTANVSGISKTGTTYMVGLLDRAYGSAPSGTNTVTFRSADEAGTTYDPLLVVTYTVGSFQTLTGSVTPTGALTKKAVHPVSGSTTPTGALTKLARQVLTGASTPTGAIVHAIRQVLSGSTTPSGTLSTGGQTQTLDGSTTPTGVITQVVRQALSGATTPTGAIVHAIRQSLSGSTTPTGTAAQIKTQRQTLDGSTTPTGAVVNLMRKAVSGSVAATGAVIHAVRQTLTGSTTPTGAVVHAIRQTLSSSVTPVGVVASKITKLLTGSITATGAISNHLNNIVFTYLRARYAPIAEMVARYAPIGFLTGRHAPRPELDARYAPTSDIEARYAPTDEEPARHAPQYEGRARHD